MTKESSRLVDRAFIFTSLGAVVAVSIAGFWLLGSPAKQRLISLDTERVNDLSAISEQLWRPVAESNGNSSDTLPDVLPDADQKTNTYLDPETGEPYEYRRLSDRTYELCATFAFESQSEESDMNWQQGTNWRHPAGRHCYKFDAARETPSSPIQ